MSTLQDQQAAIDRSIVNELIELTPEWWSSIRLEVDYTNDGEIERYAHKLWSPEVNRDYVEISPRLHRLTRDLGELFARYGRRWSKVTYGAQSNEDGTWSYRADFTYT